MNIIKSENGNLISSKELYLELGIKRDYSTWVKRSIYRACLEVDKDYIISTMKSTGGRPGVDYLLTVESAMCLIIFCQKTDKAIKLYKELSDLIGINVIQIQRTRNELLFEINLIEILSGIVEVIPQYTVLNYRIDFYIPDLNIAIEYDENNHIHYKTDKKRQEDIENYLQCDFIRINEGCELEGLNKIYKVVLYNILIDLWEKDNLNDDQTGILERLGMEIPKILNRKTITLRN
jgi:phage anti-repressor protein/very-short-patch-repair endonuclease